MTAFQPLYGGALALVFLMLAAFAMPLPGSAQTVAASDLSARVVCSSSALTVHFSWQSAGAGTQWLDVSAQANGFAPGTFAGIGPLASARERFDWLSAAPKTTYYVRVSTVSGGVWSATPTMTFTTPACGAPVVSQPLSVASGQMEQLRKDIEARIAGAAFETAVAITDLQTGETISVNGDRLHFAACAMNLLVLMQAAIDMQNGRYPEANVGQLISSTIYSSNPVPARSILFQIGNGNLYHGMERVNGLIERLGLTHTFYDHPPAYPHETLRGMSNLTTALDLNRTLVGLWNLEVMSADWRNYLLVKLREVKPGLNYLIPAAVTSGQTSHKNGFLVLSEGYIDNDTGIVTFQRGGETYAYAITFLTQRVPWEYADIPLGQAISSLAWEYFTARYGAAH